MQQPSLYASESQFGPPSDLINLADFLQRHAGLNKDFNGHGAESLSEQEMAALAAECSMEPVKKQLVDTISNPYLYAHLTHCHEDNIESILTSALADGRKKTSLKRKRAGAASDVNEEPPAEATQLQCSLDSVDLKCWSYPVGASTFMRASRNSDQNILSKPRPSTSAPSSQSEPEALAQLVLLISTYSRLSWGNYLSRSCKHALLGSQTLGDLYEALPCTSNETPLESIVDGKLTGYILDEALPHMGAVICIEGVAYGDGQTTEDYSDKLIKHNEGLPEAKRVKMDKGPGMHAQKLVDLSLRINQPYWLLHQGACEHFIVIDQVRIRHSSDPDDGYPYVLHMSPPVLDLCQACTRVPATLSIVGDIRLGQSPCKMCEPCWMVMGVPLLNGTDDNVVVVPLPKYQLGWV